MSSVLISALPNILSTGYTNDDLLVIVGYSGSPSGTTYHTPLTSFTQYVSANTASVTGVSFSNGTLTVKTPVGNYSVSGLNDIYVTGGTYNASNDTATFRNNTGGTFSVTGFTGTTLPAGVNEDVQYNNNGSFGAASLKYRASTNSTWNRGTNSIASNTVFGEDAMRSTTGSGNTIYGYQSYYTSGSTGGYNTAIGYQSLYSNTSGSSNTSIGYKTLYSNTTGSGNTTSGYYSMYSNTTGSNNMSLGFGSLSANTTGSQNVSLGYNSLITNITGSSNVAIGVNSLKLSNSNRNVGIGVNALSKLTLVSSNDNIAIGNYSLSNFTGSSQPVLAIGYNSLVTAVTNVTGTTAIGYGSLGSITGSSYDNTFVGSGAGSSITAPISGNTVIGSAAGASLSGDTNTVVGYNSGNVSGNSNVILGSNIYGVGSNNIAIGTYCLAGFSVSNNIAIGYSVMSNGVTGTGNIGIGDNSISSMTTGQNNIAVGYHSLQSTTSGSSNSAFGYNTLVSNVNTSNNSSFGYNSLSLLTSGGTNTTFGFQTGYYLVNASGTTVVGSFDNPTTHSGLTAGTNVTLIGYNALPPTSGYNTNNYIVLGNSSVATIYGAVNLTTLSDRRDKKNIESLTVGMDFVNKLRPVTFDWNMRDGGKVDIKSSGFIAQEVSEVEKESGLSDYLNLVDTTDENRYLFTPGNLLPVLVKAIQDLSKEQKELEEILKGFENK